MKPEYRNLKMPKNFNPETFDPEVQKKLLDQDTSIKAIYGFKNSQYSAMFPGEFDNIIFDSTWRIFGTEYLIIPPGYDGIFLNLKTNPEENLIFQDPIQNIRLYDFQIRLARYLENVYPDLKSLDLSKYADINQKLKDHFNQYPDLKEFSEYMDKLNPENVPVFPELLMDPVLLFNNHAGLEIHGKKIIKKFNIFTENLRIAEFKICHQKLNVVNHHKYNYYHVNEFLVRESIENNPIIAKSIEIIILQELNKMLKNQKLVWDLFYLKYKVVQENNPQLPTNTVPDVLALNIKIPGMKMKEITFNIKLFPELIKPEYLETVPNYILQGLNPELLNQALNLEEGLPKILIPLLAFKANIEIFYKMFDNSEAKRFQYAYFHTSNQDTFRRIEEMLLDPSKNPDAIRDRIKIFGKYEPNKMVLPGNLILTGQIFEKQKRKQNQKKNISGMENKNNKKNEKILKN